LLQRSLHTNDCTNVVIVLDIAYAEFIYASLGLKIKFTIGIILGTSEQKRIQHPGDRKTDVARPTVELSTVAVLNCYCFED